MIQLGDNYSELLATVPNDPRSAKGYSELFALLESLPTDDISAAELKKWMAAVEAHLSSEERSYFQKPRFR